ncbi:hypothetical protein HYH02_013432 [Chlamydomonas schloesseri]|uniref:Uncharacterized protein n=1 Tax=Chlamydomonas schloesseri TaxID=2026947 RepID=A0A835T484_9CHLO|nr:hypothetical protein HYH02_013432 [Chlamydomonas schloesseri]|eukprot:KAG2431301.1 hypothetical protein HYH02_013432 [Chlamydomonas schloesseri]
MSIKDTQEWYKHERAKVLRKAQESKARVWNLLVPGDQDGWTAVELQQPLTLFKVVSSVKGDLVSTYDGVTQYELGRWTRAKAGAAGWPPLDACFYGTQVESKALSARFPPNSKHLDSPKVLMKMEAYGKSYFHADSGWWRVPNVRPISLLPITREQAAEVMQRASQAAAAAAAAAEGASARSPWLPC